MLDKNQNFLKFIDEEKIVNLSLCFFDPFGKLYNLCMCRSALSINDLINGIRFDGSSIPGLTNINESDMLLKLEYDTAFIDPFVEQKTLAVLCYIIDPNTRSSYNHDVRNIAYRAEQYLNRSGIADTAFFGSEAEFYIFDKVKMDLQSYSVCSSESDFNNTGYGIPLKEGYCKPQPVDKNNHIKSKIVENLTKVGFSVEKYHHEVGSAGQTEINYRFSSLLKAANSLMLYKYIVKNTVFLYDKIATFMPKPIYNDNGSGLHVNQSLFKDGKNLFYSDSGYANLSELATYYIGGILKHAHSLIAFTNPTINSYKRLIPGYEAPIYLCYGKRNRSAAIRIPALTETQYHRIEFRVPDPSTNPYIAFSAILMAGIDGIKNKIKPLDPIHDNMYSVNINRKRISHTPTSLDESLLALEKDYKYLIGDSEYNVFTKEFIDRYIDSKRKEIRDNQSVPTPYDYVKYFDV